MNMVLMFIQYYSFHPRKNSTGLITMLGEQYFHLYQASYFVSHFKTAINCQITLWKQGCLCFYHGGGYISNEEENMWCLYSKRQHTNVKIST